MIDIDENISDEMLSAYIDGKATPLETIVVEQNLADQELLEVVELVADAGQQYVEDLIDLPEMAGLVSDFIRPFEEYKEIKKEIEKTHLKPPVI